MASDAGGATGGVSFCSISPSDNVGIIENFLHRIEELEKVVSQLSASNILANRLSDLSQQVGWVTGIEYLGIPGWSQTEYGTLVPPPGFSFFPNDGTGWLLSDGNRYMGGVWDSDGNLQLGIQPDGTLSGEQINTSNIAVLYTDPIVPSFTSGNFTTPATLYELYDPNSLVNITGGGSGFQFTNSGFYHLSIACQIGVTTPTLNSSAILQWAISGNTSAYGVNHNTGSNILTNLAETSNTKNTSRSMYVSSSATHSLTAIGSGLTSTFQFGIATINIQLIRRLS